MFKVEAKKRTLKILQRLSGERENKIKDVITALKVILYLLGSLMLPSLKATRTHIASELET